MERLTKRTPAGNVYLANVKDDNLLSADSDCNGGSTMTAQTSLFDWEGML